MGGLQRKPHRPYFYGTTDEQTGRYTKERSVIEEKTEY